MRVAPTTPPQPQAVRLCWNWVGVSRYRLNPWLSARAGSSASGHPVSPMAGVCRARVKVRRRRSCEAEPDCCAGVLARMQSSVEPNSHIAKQRERSDNRYVEKGERLGA